MNEEKIIPSEYYYLSKDELIFSIFENLIILFERELPKKILKSEEFEEMTDKLEVLYEKIKIEEL
jgi:hypothetical protein